MKISTTKELNLDANILVLGLFEEDTSYYDHLDKELATELSEAIENKTFSKSFGKTYSTKPSTGPCNRTLTIGLGKKEEFTLEKLRRAFSKALKFTKGRKCKDISTNLVSLSLALKKFTAKEAGRATAEALLLANYKFDKYITPKEDDPKIEVGSVSIETKETKAFEEGIKEGTIIAEATNFSRDLVNEPAIVATPTYLENKAKEIAKLKNLTLKVLERKDLEKLGMGAILGVTAASVQDPKFLILEYKGGGKEKTAIVGKGITFDSGGYNLKPTGYQITMKCDMSGAAAVLGTIKAVAELGLKKNIIAIAPCCENLVSGSGYKPGDILKAYNGKTIEIGNTDAEGRLILADALSYTEDKYKPDTMIDLATLTGACVVALGERIAAIMGKNQVLIDELKKAGDASYDRVWQLPMLEEYQDAMKGSISDLKNTAPKGHGAGSVTAGFFLSNFVDKATWAHLDIAGPAFIKEETEYLAKGATGAGVRLLCYYFMN